ncbi:GntR family transcriptional regulator [uncultured Jatrophihabitans sp.]|uniref:GntR family transcriptional regulator n=1 Tax=uncultured Jatrophihabitans sp. TaxID=1610747 RepID=UPI0035CBE050
MTTSTSATDQFAVADGIRAGILDGEFAPGQRLVEAELTARFGASRGAVRAALVDLAHEGIVERIVNRGARVRTVSLDEAVEITEARMVLEGLCAAKAAERITDDEIRELRALGEQMRAAVAAGEVMTYSQLNQRLHNRVREISAQPVAADLLGRLRAQNVRHQFRLALRPGRPQVSLPEHLAIIDEVCSHNPDAAERAARRHLTSVIEALRSEPS